MSWFIPGRRPAHVRLRLLCLPHAGGGASTYHPWGALLAPAGIEVRAVQYPGRETRLKETPMADAAALAGALAGAWGELAGTEPCAVFGHSMGGLLAHELAVELVRRQAANLPRRLFLSGRNPPHAPRLLPPLSHLSDDPFLDEIGRRYGQLPSQILANREMRALVLPALRADFTLIDAYAWRPAPPIPIPLSVLGATRDPWTSPAELEEWSRYSTAGCRVRIFEGEHFFPQAQRAEVLEAIAEDLA